MADTLDIVDGFDSVRQILTAAWAIELIPPNFAGVELQLRTETVRGLLTIAIALNDDLDGRVRALLGGPVDTKGGAAMRLVAPFGPAIRSKG